MAAGIDEGAVARESEIFVGAAGADGLLGLAVNVAPVLHQFRRRDAQRIGLRQTTVPSVVEQFDCHVARFSDRQPIDLEGKCARRQLDLRRQAVNCAARA